MSRYCTGCGREVREEDTFCPYCGNRLVVKKSAGTTGTGRADAQQARDQRKTSRTGGAQTGGQTGTQKARDQWETGRTGAQQARDQRGTGHAGDSGNRKQQVTERKSVEGKNGSKPTSAGKNSKRNKKKKRKSGLGGILLIAVAVLALLAVFLVFYKKNGTDTLLPEGNGGTSGTESVEESEEDSLSKFYLEDGTLRSSIILMSDKTQFYSNEDGEFTLTVSVPEEEASGTVTVTDDSGNALVTADASEMREEGGRLLLEKTLSIDTSVNGTTHLKAAMGEHDSCELTLYVNPHVTDEQMDTLVDVDADLAEYMEENSESIGENADEKLSAAEEFLKNDGRIAAASVDGTVVYYQTTDSLIGAYDVEPLDTSVDGSGETPAENTEASGAAASSGETGTGSEASADGTVSGAGGASEEEDAFEEDGWLLTLFQGIGTEGTTETEDGHVTSRYWMDEDDVVSCNNRVLVLIPTPEVMGSEGFNSIAFFKDGGNTLAGALGGTETILEGEEAMRSMVLSDDLARYGTVYWHCHGEVMSGNDGDHVLFLVSFTKHGDKWVFNTDDDEAEAEKLQQEEEAAYEWNPHGKGQEDFNDYFFGNINKPEDFRMILYAKDRVANGEDGAGIYMTDRFLVNWYMDFTFPNTLFYFGTCSGIRSDLLSNFLLAHGAAGVYGYKKEALNQVDAEKCRYLGEHSGQISSENPERTMVFQEIAYLYSGSGELQTNLDSAAVQNEQLEDDGFVLYDTPRSHSDWEYLTTCYFLGKTGFYYQGTGTLEGRVLTKETGEEDSAAVPLSGASVKIYRFLNTGFSKIDTLTTDADGHFRAEKYASGYYILSVRDRSGNEKVVSADLETGTFDGGDIILESTGVKNNGGYAVGYGANTYYWKYNANSFESTGVYGYFYPVSETVNQLICRENETGAETVLYEGTGYDELWISGESIWFKTNYASWKSIGLDGSTGDSVTFNGQVLGADEETGYLIAFDSDMGGIITIDRDGVKNLICGMSDATSETVGLFETVDGKGFFWSIVGSGSGSVDVFSVGLTDGSWADYGRYTVEDPEGVLLTSGIDVTTAHSDTNLYLCVNPVVGSGTFYYPGAIWKIAIDGSEVAELKNATDADAPQTSGIVITQDETIGTRLWYCADSGYTIHEDTMHPWRDSMTEMQIDKILTSAASGMLTEYDGYAVAEGGICIRLDESSMELTQIVSAGTLSNAGYPSLSGTASGDTVYYVSRYSRVGQTAFIEITEMRSAAIAGGLNGGMGYDRTKSTLWAVPIGEDSMTAIYSY